MSNLENINKFNMKNFMAADKKVINRIKDCIATIFTKQKIMREWDTKYKWVFDENWNFVKWKVYVWEPCSCIRDGEFRTIITSDWKKYVVLKEWKREYNSGLVEVWKFDEWEVLFKWERYALSGIVYKWLFDVNTWRLYDWEIIYPNGNIQTVNKLKK